MKAWGLCLSIIMLGAACSTPRTNMPIGSPIEPYLGPTLDAPFDYDRADAGKMKWAPHVATPIPVST